MNTFEKSKVVTISLWVVVLSWLVFIFVLSAQPAVQSRGISEKVTKSIIEAIVWIVQVDIDAKTINALVTQFHNLVRKFAHGLVYFVLGILVIKTFINKGIMGFRAYIFTIVFCFSYAVIDEIHQVFVAGRGGQISDILIDIAGSILGMGMYWVYYYLLNSKRSS